MFCDAITSEMKFSLIIFYKFLNIIEMIISDVKVLYYPYLNKF